MIRHRAAAFWILTLGLAGVNPAAAAPDPGMLMRKIAAEPFRYGGSLQGTVPGLKAAVDPPPIHLSIGLAAPDAQGRLWGDAILFDQKRRLIAFGHVAGITGGPTGACSLRLSLPAEEMTLHGVCTATSLSGEIVSRPHRAGLLTRLVSWWGDDAVAGRYWLTPASFDPGS